MTPFLSTYNYGANRPTVLTDPSGACPWCIIGGALIGAAIGGIDCAADFSGWGNCAKKVGIGAAAGALVGAGLGYLATAGLSAGATLAIGLGIEAAGTVAYGYASANATGGSYGWGDAAWDVGATFAGGAAGALLGKGLSIAGRATGITSKLSEAATWLKNNPFKGRPKTSTRSPIFRQPRPPGNKRP